MINTGKADIVQLQNMKDKYLYPITISNAIGMSDGSGNLDEYLKKLRGFGDIMAYATAKSIPHNSEAFAKVSVSKDSNKNYTFNFKFEIPRGEPGKGEPGEPGRDGIDAVGGRTIFAFKHDDNKPDRPIGGVWNLYTNEVTPPAGWQNNSSELTHPIWMSTCVFNSAGYPDDAGWSDPIKITGKDGDAGADGLNLQFIYFLAKDDSEENKPAKPEGAGLDGYEVPEDIYNKGWRNHPQGVSVDYRAEYMCFSRKLADMWTPWEGPVLWSNYGVNGMDGDGILYAFKLQEGNMPPERPKGSGKDGEVPIKPEGVVDEHWWTDEPSGVTVELKHEYVTVTRKNHKTGEWSQWSKPALWAMYGIKGEPGIAGRNALAFTASRDKPKAPQGGSWNVDTNTVTPPKDPDETLIWHISDDFSNPDKLPIWLSAGVFNEKGKLISVWSDPVSISGKDGENGTDGGNVQFIYKLVHDESARPLNPPSEEPKDDFKAPPGWTDHPTGVDEDNRTEYMCVSYKRSAETGWVNSKGERGKWDGPFLWSNYGINGLDGDGVKYAYFINADGVNPGLPDNPGTGEHLEIPQWDGYPEPDRKPRVWWTDDPSGVNETNQWEWVTTSKRINGVWEPWGGKEKKVSLWAKFGQNGYDAIEQRVMYQMTESSSDAPHVVQTDPNPGSEWSLVMPTRPDKHHFIWATRARFTVDNELYNDPKNPKAFGWSQAYLMTGVDGIDATPPDYKVYIYKSQKDKPDKPNFEYPDNTPGWEDFPNKPDEIWWQSIGSVNGRTGTIKDDGAENPTYEWSEPLQVNGMNGTSLKILGTYDSYEEMVQEHPTGEDGDTYIIDGELWSWGNGKWNNAGPIQGPFTEFRFARSVDDRAPDITTSDRDPSTSYATWSVKYPSINISAGESMWQTHAVINPDNTLQGIWDDPARISGEQGRTGDTGGPGPAGDPGIPGRFIETRYCLGTDVDYLGTHDVNVPDGGSVIRYPDKWLDICPEVTKEYPYIWFIQATIKYKNNDDEDGTVVMKEIPGEGKKRGWSEPSRLSGLPGTPGKGQIVYPAGIYSTKESYKADKNKTPYVLNTRDQKYYVLNKTDVVWKGDDQGGAYPDDEKAKDWWVPFEMFKAIYSDIGIFGNALVGDAVFNRQFMFSQIGIDKNGGPVGEGDTINAYEGFLSNYTWDKNERYPSDANPYDPANDFRPSMCIDFWNGDVWTNFGKTHFKRDGGGFLANGNINWDKEGTTTFGGDIVLSNEGNISTGKSKSDSNAGISGEGSYGSSVRFWAGNSYANRNSAPFRVTHDGHLYAENAEISGDIVCNKLTVKDKNQYSAPGLKLAVLITWNGGYHATDLYKVNGWHSVGTPYEHSHKEIVFSYYAPGATTSNPSDGLVVTACYTANPKTTWNNVVGGSGHDQSSCSVTGVSGTQVQIARYSGDNSTGHTDDKKFCLLVQFYTY